MMGDRAKESNMRAGIVARRAGVCVLLLCASMFGSSVDAQQISTPSATVTVVATPASPTASPIPTPTPPSTPVNGYVSANAELDEVIWARQIDPATNAPKRTATGFITTDATIYATIAVKRIDAGVTLTAEWSLNGIPVPALNANIPLDQGYENGWVEFHLTKAATEIWPIGTYTIDISVNGVPALTADVDVTVPPS